MRINNKHYQSIWLKPEDPSIVQIIDQRLLPFEFKIINLKNIEDIFAAIKDMKVRGAPLIGATTGGDDLKDQVSGNYSYNDIGQLTENISDDNYFEYNVSGRVTGIYNDAVHSEATRVAAYTYDDRGFRLMKYDKVHDLYTWYIRDLSGNILYLYTKERTGNIRLNEVPVYGASRLGVARFNTSETLEKYTYELTDHLGNVRAVISENYDNDDGFSDYDFDDYADYYPFGMKMPGFCFKISFNPNPLKRGYNWSIA